jgi:hypothetical protein
MSASTTRPVRHSIPLPLSIVARPHEAGLIRSWRADSLAFVWLDPGITPCCKTLFGSLKTNFPGGRSGDRIIVRGTTATNDELTGKFGSTLEDTSIGDCRLVALFAEKSLQVIFGVLQHYLPKPEVRDGHRFIQLVQAPPTDAAKDKPPDRCKAWSFQSTLADCRAWKVSSIGLGSSFLLARTPLTIVAHRLPGRRVVIRPTLGAIGSISAARYH